MGKKQEAESSEKERTIFISGLPYTTTQDEIQALFKECGQIIQIKLPKYQDTGRNIGYAHIVYQTAAEAQEGLKKNNCTIGGRYIVVQKAKGESTAKTNNEAPPEGCKSVFIKNLPYDITSDQIGEAFIHCGPLENIRMVYNTSTDNFKGFSYIDFKREDSIIAALKMNGQDVGGRQIYVDFETGQAKRGFRYNDGQIKNSKYNKEIQEISKKKIKKEKVQKKKASIQNFAQVQKDEQIKIKKQQQQAL